METFFFRKAVRGLLLKLVIDLVIKLIRIDYLLLGKVAYFVGEPGAVPNLSRTLVYKTYLSKT